MKCFLHHHWLLAGLASDLLEKWKRHVQTNSLVALQARMLHGLKEKRRENQFLPPT